MRATGVLCGLAAGAGVGALAALLYLSPAKPAGAAASDRYEDYVMTTGAVQISPKLQTDGVWLLDYKSGKLLGTVIDKALGKIVGWAEVDLVHEFEVAPKQDVHFMMVTGWVGANQSALYVAETTTGKFGVYTMGPADAGGGGVVIRRHDMATFRQVAGPKPGFLPGGGADAKPADGAKPVVPAAATVPATAPMTPTAPAAPGGLPPLPAAGDGKK